MKPPQASHSRMAATSAGGGPVRICYITSGLAAGGAEAMLYNLVTSMDRERFEPVVVSLRNGGLVAARLAEREVPVHMMGLAPHRAPVGGLWRLVGLVRKLRPDVLQGWLYHGNAAACVGRVLPGRPAVVWGIHATTSSLDTEKWATRGVIRAGAPLSRAATRIVYCSHVGAAHHKAIGYAAERAEVIPNGFDCAQFAPSRESRDRLRQELGRRDDDILVGLVARYHPVKDHTTFLRAAARIAASDAAVNVNFVLAGSGVERSNVALVQTIRDLRLTNRVHLLGEREDIAAVTAGLDIACLSSTAEAFPNVVGEAMAGGIPCVVTDVGDARWIVGETGRVVPTRDPEAFAQAVLAMLDLGPEGRRALGASARERIIDKFSLPSVVRRYEALYAAVSRKPVGCR